jgi:preprotein translocase subunit SecD
MRKDGIQTRKRRPKGPKGLSVCNGSDVTKATPSPQQQQQQQQQQLQQANESKRKLSTFKQCLEHNVLQNSANYRCRISSR